VTRPLTQSCVRRSVIKCAQSNNSKLVNRTFNLSVFMCVFQLIVATQTRRCVSGVKHWLRDLCCNSSVKTNTRSRIGIMHNCLW